MLKAVKVDLENLCDDVEQIKASLPRLILAEKVDVAARLGAARKTLESIDQLIKDEIKSHLKHRPGTEKGENFQAMLDIISVTRLDQKALKEADPSTYDTYSKKVFEERVNFKPKG